MAKAKKKDPGKGAGVVAALAVFGALLTCALGHAAMVSH